MRIRSLSALLLLFGLTACSGGELVGIHLDLAADGTGTVTTKALRATEEVPPAEARSKGARWTTRAALVASQGTFQKIADLQLGDGGVTFAPDLEGDRPGLRIRLKRGPKTPWIEALAPDLAGRRDLAKAYDPTGQTDEIGDVLRIDIEAPGAIITSGVLPTDRGVEAGKDGDSAYLLLPVRTAMQAGDDFVWELSWLKGK